MFADCELLPPTTKLRQGNLFTPGGGGSSWTETPLNKDPLDRDPLHRQRPHGQRPPWTETPSPRQRPSWTETPLNRDPPGHRPSPEHRSPLWIKTPWTETPLPTNHTVTSVWYASYWNFFHETESHSGYKLETFCRNLRHVHKR